MGRAFLKAVISTDEPESRKKKPLLYLCTTHWAATQEAYDHFAAVFPHLIVTLVIIVRSLHRDCNYDPLFLDGWSTDCKRRAFGLDRVWLYGCVYNHTPLAVTSSRNHSASAWKGH